jgi:ribosomal protein S18 acetylase RimI-like enzyme
VANSHADVVCRSMNSADVAAVADLHIASWAAHELSVKLGVKFLRRFYATVVSDPDSFGRVCERDGMILGYAVGFHDYLGFNRRFSSDNRFFLAGVLVSALLQSKMSIADVRRLVCDARKTKKAQFKQWHLGALAIDARIKRTELGSLAIRMAIGAVLDELRRRGARGCAAVCDEVNVPVQRLFQRMGFSIVETIDYEDRSVVLFEQAFVPGSTESLLEVEL